MIGVVKSSDISKLTNNSQGSIFGDARNAFKDLQSRLGASLASRISLCARSLARFLPIPDKLFKKSMISASFVSNTILGCGNLRTILSQHTQTRFSIEWLSCQFCLRHHVSKRRTVLALSPLYIVKEKVLNDYSVE